MNPRVLFVGEIHSSHARSWARMLKGSQFELRGYQCARVYFEAMAHLPYLTYVPLGTGLLPGGDSLRRPRRAVRVADRMAPWLAKGHEYRWLARVIREWRPHIVHSLGLTPGGEFVQTARQDFGLAFEGRWIAQLRGGSDLTLSRLDPLRGPKLAGIASAADALISDNPVNFEYLQTLGVRTEAHNRLVVPGTGGLDVDAIQRSITTPPSRRRLILWIKAYEASPWSKGLPVLEALRDVWRQLTPCKLVALAVDREVQDWIRQCPADMQRDIEVHPRIAHEHALDLMRQARVMLAPSLVDGTPNSMWEAMACGAAPIVSPLPTITPIARDGENVLFARNLRPDEIGKALVTAMTDDRLVDSMAANNLELVRERADQRKVKEVVIDFYRRQVEQI